MVHGAYRHKISTAYIEDGMTGARDCCAELQTSPLDCLDGVANICWVGEVIHRVRLTVVKGGYALANGLIVRLDAASSICDEGNKTGNL